MPKRIYCESEGKTPENAVFVGKGSKFQNSYIVTKKKDGTYVVKETNRGRRRRCLHDTGYQTTFSDKISAHNDSVLKYKEYIFPYIHPLDLGTLRGKDLACKCPLDMPCHADVLLKFANDKEYLKSIGFLIKD